MYHDIIEFGRDIRITIPKKKLRKLYHESRIISDAEYWQLHRFARKIEDMEAKLAHVRSIAQVLMLRRV